MTYENIDFDKLRNDLLDYFGSAMFSGLWLAITEVARIENANEEELLEIAIKNKFDLSKYIKHKSL